MEQKAMISIGNKFKKMKVDKNGYLLIKLKELPQILDGGSALNVELNLEEWLIVKKWVDFHYDKTKFFDDFPDEKIYNPFIAKLLREEKNSKKKWWEFWK